MAWVSETVCTNNSELFVQPVPYDALWFVVDLPNRGEDPIVLFPGDTVRDAFERLGTSPESWLVRKIKASDSPSMIPADLRGEIADLAAKAFVAGRELQHELWTESEFRGTGEE